MKHPFFSKQDQRLSQAGNINFPGAGGGGWQGSGGRKGMMMQVNEKRNPGTGLVVQVDLGGDGKGPLVASAAERSRIFPLAFFLLPSLQFLPWCVLFLLFQ